MNSIEYRVKRKHIRKVLRIFRSEFSESLTTRHCEEAIEGRRRIGLYEAIMELCKKPIANFRWRKVMSTLMIQLTITPRK